MRNEPLPWSEEAEDVPILSAASERWRNRRLVTIRDVAAMLACSVKTLRRWIDEDRFLQPLKMPGPFRWRVVDVQAWLDKLPTRDRTT
jgi:predicted DNA-binding transcriptional regulator AlpA